MGESPDPSPPSPTPQQQAFLENYSRDGGFERFGVPGMGTENVLLLPTASEQALGALAQAAFRQLERLERILSKFRADSDLTQVNEEGAVRAVRVDEELFRTLTLARAAWECTGGRFDPTIGPLMEAWGLVDMEGRVPPSEEVEHLRSRCGMDKVLLDAADCTVRLSSPEVRLDLGGIGKGYAADRLVEGLQKAGVEAGAVLCGRSTTVTWGLAPGESRWHFEVVHPAEPTEALTTLQAVPGAVSSSGAYERRVRVGTEDYGHILDPQSGLPGRGLSAATVWTGNGVLGDVLSTVLYLDPDWLDEAPGEFARLASAAEVEARCSALLVTADASSWGGLATRAVHVGPPAW